MLVRPPQPTPDTEEPWSDDKLGRSRSAHKVKNLLLSAQGPITLAIHAKYGMGKTFFVSRMCQELKNDGVFSFYFNAWETDLSSNPLLAFTSEFTEQIQNQGVSLEKDKVNEILKGVGAYLGTRALPFAVRLASSGLIDLNQLREMTGISASEASSIPDRFESIAKDAVESYQAAKKTKIDVRSQLNDIAETVSAGSGRPIYVFVDELDRCRPSYVIDFLESIKHIFDLPNFIFVITIDRNQLESAVHATFGSKIDIHGYLRRFVDWSITLPEPRREQYIDFLSEHYRMQEAFGDLREAQGELRGFLQNFKSMTEIYLPTLRAVEQGMLQSNACLRLLEGNKARYGPAVGILTGVKIGDPELYHEFLYRRTPGEVFIQQLEKESGDIENFVGGWIMAIATEDSDYLEEKLNDIESGRLSMGDRENQKWRDVYYVAKEIHNKISFRFGFRGSAVREYLAEVLELSERDI